VPSTYLHPKVKVKRNHRKPPRVRAERGDRNVTLLLIVLMWWLVISFFTGLITGRVLRRLDELG